VRLYLKGSALKQVQPSVVGWYLVGIRKLGEMALLLLASETLPIGAATIWQQQQGQDGAAAAAEAPTSSATATSSTFRRVIECL